MIPRSLQAASKGFLAPRQFPDRFALFSGAGAESVQTGHLSAHKSSGSFYPLYHTSQRPVASYQRLDMGRDRPVEELRQFCLDTHDGSS